MNGFLYFNSERNVHKPEVLCIVHQITLQTISVFEYGNAIAGRAFAPVSSFSSGEREDILSSYIFVRYLFMKETIAAATTIA